MKDRSFDRYKQAKLGEGLTKETARARYENLKTEKQIETIALRENWVDIKIKKAIADGELDGLPGKGRPLDMAHYHELPEHLRVAYQMLKNSGFLPEEVRLKKEMEILKEKIRDSPSETQRHDLLAQLTRVSEKYHLCMEYNKGFRKTMY